MPSPIELYIHYPFCVRKCLYCDFLSSPSNEETRKRYLEALKREIRQAADPSASVRSVFFGGGTPSLMSGEAMTELMTLIRDSFSLLPDAEITAEVNPGTLTAEKARAYREAGVNRISLGVQSFNDECLKAAGRIHSAEEAEQAVRLCREAGFANLSMDLMLGLPGETRESLRKTLEQAVSLKPEHLSCYSLIVEEGTPFAALQEQGRLALPDEDSEREMYWDTVRFLKEHGYHRYEISNFATDGFESVHNKGYWEGVGYLGFGLGASSFVTADGTNGTYGCRFKNTSSLDEYLNAADFTELREEEEVIDRLSAMEEFMFLGLREAKGVSASDFEARFGMRPETIYRDAINSNIENGLLLFDNGRYRLSEKGFDLGNIVFASFLLEE